MQAVYENIYIDFATILRKLSAGKTLGEIAADVDIEWNEFENYLKKFSKKTRDQLRKLDEKNRLKRQTKEQEKEKVVKKDTITVKVENFEETVTKSEKVQDLNYCTKSSELRNCVRELDSELKDEKENNIKLRNELDIAILNLEQAQQIKNFVEEKVKDSEKRISYIRKKMVELEEMREKFITYLVAPNYNGEMPKCGKTISEYNITDEDALTFVEQEYSFTKVMEAGYDSMKEVIQAIKYVMTCIEFLEKDIDCKTLIDDDRIVALIDMMSNE